MTNASPEPRPDLSGQSVETRLSRLEDVAFEGDDLARAVARLGANVAALGQALLAVDRQQQELTRLASDIRSVESRSVTKTELQDTQEKLARETARFRQKTVRRIVTTGALLLLVLATLSLYLQQGRAQQDVGRYEDCLGLRNASVSVQTYVTDERRIANSPFFPPELRKQRLGSLDRLSAAFPVPDCERLRQ